ncbi:MAG: hypothetical protein WC856_27880 [Methylococcaceae bacterium]|jgi:hypothetical protein
MKRNTVITVVFLMLMVAVMSQSASALGDFQGVTTSIKKVERNGGLTAKPELFLTDKIDMATISAEIKAKLARIQTIVDSGKMTKECLELEDQIQAGRLEVRVRNRTGHNEVYIAGRLPGTNVSGYAIDFASANQVFVANSVPEFPNVVSWVKLKVTELNFREIKKRMAFVSSDSFEFLNALAYDRQEKCYWYNASAYNAGNYSVVFDYNSMGGERTMYLVIIEFNSKFEISQQFATGINVVDPCRELTDAEKAFLRYSLGMTASNGSDFLPKEPKIPDEVKEVLKPKAEATSRSPIKKVEPPKIDFFTACSYKLVEDEKAVFSHQTSGDVDQVFLDGVKVNQCEKGYEWPIKCSGDHTLIAIGPNGVTTKSIFIEMASKPQLPLPCPSATATPTATSTATPSSTLTVAPEPTKTPEAPREPEKPRKAKPVIEKFEGDKLDIIAGEAVILQWIVYNADCGGVTIDDEVVASAMGKKWFYPTHSATYRLRARNEAGEVAKTFNIKVNPAPAPQPPPVVEKQTERKVDVPREKPCGFGTVEIHLRFEDCNGNLSDKDQNGEYLTSSGFIVQTETGANKIGCMRYAVKLRNVPAGRFAFDFSQNKDGITWENADRQYTVNDGRTTTIILIRKGGE